MSQNDHSGQPFTAIPNADLADWSVHNCNDPPLSIDPMSGLHGPTHIRGQTNARIPEPTHSDYRQQRGGEKCVGRESCRFNPCSLAEVALPRATALIWLDFPWSTCRAGVLARDPRRGATDEDTVELLKWAETYWGRQTSSSFVGHSQMFNDFPSTKFKLGNREQATQLLTDVRTCAIALKCDE
jgi:hypothetical protein